MKDLVERQAVLDLIHENWYASNEFYLNHIMEIPSIDDISVRHGKWIGTEDKDEQYGYVYKCSVCGTSTIGDSERFCGWCGARMDKDE